MCRRCLVLCNLDARHKAQRGKLSPWNPFSDLIVHWISPIWYLDSVLGPCYCNAKTEEAKVKKITVVQVIPAPNASAGLRQPRRKAKI